MEALDQSGQTVKSRAGTFLRSDPAHAHEAIKLARRELPRLIILDVMMPDMDGWTVLRQIQETEATKAIPVIMLSGYADLMTKEESLRSGATFFLVKPISAEQLLSLVRRLVPRPELHGTANKTRK